MRDFRPLANFTAKSEQACRQEASSPPESKVATRKNGDAIRVGSLARQTLHTLAIGKASQTTRV
jgi:hypothetical protein